MTDQQLLREYTERRSEVAFAELVRRHVDFVYSAALRMVRDPHLAEDVSQGVFLALAQQARQLRERAVLSGWLHRTARNLAANTVRTEERRRAREQESAAMNDLLSAEPGADWEDIALQLDAVLGELEEGDRDALLLRYFERKSAREMAQTLGVSDEAAQKRVSRAVERLREGLAGRGVTIGATGLALAISANAIKAAPAGLAASISSAAALGGLTITTAATATLTKTIAMTTFQKALVAATVVVLGGGGIYEARQAANLRRQVTRYEQQQVKLAAQLQQLQRQRDEATNQLVSLQLEKAEMTNNTAELLRLRGMAGVARRATQDAEQLRAQLARQAPGDVNNLVTSAMADAMKQGVEQQYEGQLSRMTAGLHLTPEQVQAARAILMRQAQAMSAGMQQGISGRFDKAELMRMAKEAGDPDTQIKALLTPDQQSLFPAYQQDEQAHTARLSANNDLMQMQSTLDLTPEQSDRVYAAMYDLSLKQLSGNQDQKFASASDAMQWALEQKVVAVTPILTESQLLRYRQQQAAQAKLVKDLMEKLEASSVPK